MGLRVKPAWLAAILLGPFGLLPSGSSQNSWPHERSALVQDNRVLWGELDNGFRYAVLPSGGETGGVSLRLAVNVGSLQETEKESGYAHLIEHLAFEGAGEFSGESIDRLFREMGLSLGDDVNGFTTHHYTSYRLELRNGDAAALGQALRLYRGFADGIDFDQKSIEKQQAIVLAEKLRYNSPAAQFGEKAFEQTMRGSLYATRPIIGTKSAVESATRNQLRAFYKKWYRPDLMMLIVVGDVDPGQLASEIEDRFGSLVSPERRGSFPDIGEIEENQSARATLLQLEGLDRALIDLSRAWNEPRGRDSVRIRERDFLRSFATELLNERFQRFIGAFDSDFVTYDSRFKAPFAHARLTTSREKWLTGLTLLDRMIRQATRHGFHPEEIDSLKTRWRKRLENRAALRQAFNSASIASAIEQETLAGRVYLSPENGYAMESGFLAALDERELTRALRDCWKTTGMSVVVGGNVPEKATTRQLARDFAGYRKTEVEPYDYELRRSVVWQSNSDEIGAIEEKDIDGVDDAIVVDYENLTRLTYLNTRNEPGFAHVLIRLSPQALNGTNPSNPAIRSIAMDSLLWSGVEGYDWEEIHQELSARVFDFSYAIEGTDCLCFRARCDASELEWLLNTIASYVEKGSVSRKGFAFAKTNMLRALHVELDGLALAKRNVQRKLFPNRPEFWDPQLTEGYQLEQEEVQEWLSERIAASRIEIVVVGDIEESVAKKGVAASFGALEKPRAGDSGKTTNPIDHPNPGYERIAYGENQDGRSLAIGNWILGPGPSTFSDRMALTIAEGILRDRIIAKTRREMASSYETKVDYWSFPAFPDFQRFRIETDCSTENLDSVLEAIEEVCRDLAETPPSHEEVDRVKTLLMARYDAGHADNRFILENVLYSVSEYPDWVSEWGEILSGGMDEIEPERIRQVCGRWLRWEDAVVASVEPKQGEG